MNKYHKTYLETKDNILNELVQEIEWSVQVPGDVGIDREKEEKAVEEAKKAIDKMILDIIGPDFDVADEMEKVGLDFLKLKSIAVTCNVVNRFKSEKRKIIEG